MNPQIKEQLDKICEDYQKEVVRLDSLLNSLDEELFETIRKPLEIGVGFSTLQLIAKRGEFTKALDAKYWLKVLNLGDIVNLMPKSNWEEWQKAIYSQSTRAFIPDLAKDLVVYNLDNRDKVLGSKVVELFNSMYWREDDDKRKKGFNQPLEFDLGLYSTASMGRLRETLLTVAKVMDIEDNLNQTDTFIEYHIPTNGEGYWIAGGVALVKKYQKGTAKLELHPVIVRKLNSYLRQEYPDLIEDVDTQEKRLSKLEKKLPMPELSKRVLNYSESKELIWALSKYNYSDNTLLIHSYKLTEALKELLFLVCDKCEDTEIEEKGRDNVYSAKKYYFDKDMTDNLRLMAYFGNILPH